MREQELPGNFVVIEGADGAGTTTMSRHIEEEFDYYWTHEPTEGKIGQKVDELISSENYSAAAVALSFAADRMVHLEEEVIPKLKKGENVVCDRYYHSSLVYQPAMGLNFDWVKSLNKKALRPDLTVIIDVSAEEGMERVDDRGRDENIFEDLEFQKEVVLRYRKLEKRLKENIKIVDGTRSKNEVKSRVAELVKKNI